MRINQIAKDETTVLELEGQFDRTEDDQFVAHVDVLLDEGRNKVVVDLTGAALVTSTGFGALLTSCRRLRDAGGDLVLVGLEGVILKAFQLLELGGKIPVFPSEEEARSYLASLDAPPMEVDGGIAAKLDSEIAEPFDARITSISEREVQLDVAKGAGPILARGDRLRVRFELPDGTPVEGAHLDLTGVAQADDVVHVQASFDLLPRKAREAIRNYVR